MIAEITAPRKCVDRNAGQQQRGHGEVPADGSDAVDEKRRRRSANEGERRQGQEEDARGPGGDRDHGAQRPARGDPDDPGVGHGVAE